MLFSVSAEQTLIMRLFRVLDPPGFRQVCNYGLRHIHMTSYSGFLILSIYSEQLLNYVWKVCRL